MVPDGDTGELRSFLVESSLISADDSMSVQPLAGGVSSDIYLVRTATAQVVVKRALAQLKVEGTWLAPVSRSSNEAAYLEVAERLDPGFCPKLLAHDPASGYLAMEYFPPTDHQLWKDQLLGGHVDAVFAGAVGDHLGRIHSASARDSELAHRFETTSEFTSLRINPYLVTLKERYEDLVGTIDALIESLLSHGRTLVHGDVSPKNILEGPSGPVLLDAECAWWGDPAFDLAFCLNHLFLKSFLPLDRTHALMESVSTLVAGYEKHVDWEPSGHVESRAASLLPALMLARVDGLSPVEYFDTEQQQAVRRFSMEMLSEPDLSLDWIVRTRLEMSR